MAKPDKGHVWFGRRDFASKVGWGSFFAFMGVMLGGSLRFMFPRVLFEPSTTFKAGLPTDYVVGVSEKYKNEKRVWIVKNEEGFFALSAICTHLGCTPRWLSSEDKFKCPCHGSGFYRDGINFEGPAPRPLERFKITKADDGQLLIDKSVKFLWEKGQWDKPGAFLYV